MASLSEIKQSVQSVQGQVESALPGLNQAREEVEQAIASLVRVFEDSSDTTGDDVKRSLDSVLEGIDSATTVLSQVTGELTEYAGRL